MSIYERVANLERRMAAQEKRGDRLAALAESRGCSPDKGATTEDLVLEGLVRPRRPLASLFSHLRLRPHPLQEIPEPRVIPKHADDEPSLSEDEFVVLLQLNMINDPWPLTSKADATYQSLLERESAMRGYKDWVEAYHTLVKTKVDPPPITG